MLFVNFDYMKEIHLGDCRLFVGLRQKIGHRFKDVREAEIGTRGPTIQDT
jgi:hypothetical protein